jgi:hypothetical protein
VTPSARATAEETPAPMPLLVVCSTIITQGNASEAPASALVPMRPRKNPSNVMTPGPPIPLDRLSEGDAEGREDRSLPRLLAAGGSSRRRPAARRG